MQPYAQDLTVTERRLMAKLSSGRAYSMEEMRACLSDPLAGDSAIRFHVCNLRAKLRRYGRGIEARRVSRTTYYRQVLLLSRHDE